jgi:hypothetical protein
VASKHDAKHARANFWVTQQNLAKQKGGFPGWQFKEKAPRPKPAAQPAVQKSEAPKADPSVSEATSDESLDAKK